jgi:uncharacterized protein (TIGR00725 family)
MRSRTPYIAVIGGHEATDAERALAAEVGQRLAESCAILLSGGDGGIMEASCEAAHRAGGVTIGILADSNRSHANAFLTAALPTGLGEMRNALIVRAADALIAIGSGWGTLSEIALGMRTGKRVVALRTWAVTPPRPTDLSLMIAATPEDAVRLALSEVIDHT